MEPDSLLSQALYYDFNEAISNNPVPSNGHEYLLKVMQEAAQCPQTVVAELDVLKKAPNNQTLYVNGEENLPKPPPILVPTKKWQQEQLQQFNELRDKVANLRLSQKHPLKTDLPKDEKGWFTYCLGGDGVDPKPPYVSVLLSLNQTDYELIIEYFVKWLTEDEFPLNQQCTVWLHSLLVCLETPLHPDTCSLLRSISKFAWKYRTEEIRSTDHQLLVPLNILICIIARFFGQLDLADK